MFRQYNRIGTEMKLVSILLAVFLTACAGSGTHRAEPSDVGWVTRGVFERPLYEPFRTGYDTAHVAGEFVPLIRILAPGTSVTVFFGGWCGDSKRQVPHFLKIMDAAGVSSDSIRIYALDRTKKSGDGLTDRYAITAVPTFIFLKGGEEIGRITESPTTTLEADVLTILGKKAEAKNPGHVGTPSP